ncbi:N-acetyltransferase [Vulcanisaeta thermophila]|uniref:N-acetyltransferase n=1 Tax=Vulcanisaeta thermophila TaxID=867917 RepID=UPI000853A1B8|nr:N-acetyltransferase [Vulcanisaeta thermophila]
MTYISRAAKILSSRVSADVVILGPTVIGEGTIVEPMVVIGHPVRAKLMKALGSDLGIDEYMDSISSGSQIGSNCIIRSGTVIYEDVVLGDNVETGHNVLIREGTRIGSGTRVGSGVIIDGETIIGSNVSIQSMVYIPRGTVIEDGVFLGPNVVITNDKYPPSRRLDGVRIRRGAVIGANSTLIAGIEIGENAVVAAGSVVTKDVPPNKVVMGVPARPVYDVDVFIRKRAEYEGSKAP